MKKLWKLMLALTVAVSLTACSDDDDKNDPTPDPEDVNGSTVYDETTTTEDQWISQTATKVLNLFNPNDQKSVINFFNDLDDLYGDYDMPEEWDDAASDDANRAAHALAQALRSGAYFNLASRAKSYTIALSRFSGVYIPNSRYREWVKSSDSDDVVFQFNNSSGVACEIRVAGQSSTWTNSFRADGDNYKVTVPKTLTLTAKQGNTTLVTVVVDSDVTIDSHANVNTDIKASNLHLAEVASCTNTSGTVSVTLYVNDEVVVTGKGTINGQHLCSYDTWVDVAEDGMPAIAQQMLKSGEATVNIIGNIIVTGKISNPYNFFDVLDEGYWDTWDYSYPEREAKSAATKIANACSASMTFNGSSKERGTLGWEAYQSWAWGNNQEWSVRPTLCLATSSSPIAFDTYFNRARFGSVEDLFESVRNSYENAFK